MKTKKSKRRRVTFVFAAVLFAWLTASYVHVNLATSYSANGESGVTRVEDTRRSYPIPDRAVWEAAFRLVQKIVQHFGQ